MTKKTLSDLKRNALVAFALILFVSCISGCSFVKLVANYDPATAELAIKLSKEIDMFYGKMLEMQAAQREYAKFTDKYLEIEVDLGSLILRNKMHPMNQESTKIAETILEKWVKYKNKHKEKNTYGDGLAKLHRKRFTRLFTAMSVAEEAKRLAGEDLKDEE